jgi:hypothetical protein
MHRVLAIPEILRMILQMTDRRSNYNNALVCQMWSEIALDIVWECVDDLYNLFSLLAPLEKSNGVYVCMFLETFVQWHMSQTSL